MCPALLLVIAAVCGEGLQDNKELSTCDSDLGTLSMRSILLSLIHRRENGL